MQSSLVDINYTRNLIKGKIAEVIFEEMFRVSGEFTILPLGYEHTTPVLAQYQHLAHVQNVLDNIRHAPDFALISQDKTKVFLVEVKYRNSFTNDEVLEIAKSLYTKWNPCFLFITSKSGFYFDSIKEIISNDRNIKKLANNWVSIQIQQEYLNLLEDL